MKKHLLVFALLASSLLMAQNESKTEDFRFRPQIRFQLNTSSQFGNTALADAHKPKLGATVQLNFFDFRHFQAGGGLDFMTYKVTDPQKIGNIEKSKSTSLYGFLAYEARLTKRISLIPDLGYGFLVLNLKDSGRKYGGQDGRELRAGVNVDFNLNNEYALYLSLHYIESRYDIQTTPDLMDYFGKSHQLQVGVGLKMGK